MTLLSRPNCLVTACIPPACTKKVFSGGISTPSSSKINKVSKLIVPSCICFVYRFSTALNSFVAMFSFLGSILSVFVEMSGCLISMISALFVVCDNGAVLGVFSCMIFRTRVSPFCISFCMCSPFGIAYPSGTVWKIVGSMVVSSVNVGCWSASVRSG